VGTYINPLVQRQIAESERIAKRKARVLLLATYLDRIIEANVSLRPIFPRPVKVFKSKNKRRHSSQANTRS